MEPHPTDQRLPETRVEAKLGVTDETHQGEDSGACRMGMEPHAHKPPVVAKLTPGRRKDKQNLRSTER